ncbi:zinc finger, CCHC-type containing protein [Tanacetum coccineum]
MNYLRVWGCRAVVRLFDIKLRTLGERGIKCIFVGYAKHSKAFKFYVIKPNESVSINSIIESRDAIFDENRFSSISRLSLRIPNRTKDMDGLVVPEKVIEEVVAQQPEPDLRKSNRNRTPKNFGPEFQLYLIEGTRDETQAINDEMDSILGNNTWVLADLPLGCKPLCCKWIFKRKLKVDRTIEKFKARLVIQGFRQKSRINYFHTYAPVARIRTIRLLIAMTSIHNLITHQMDMKTTFLKGELDKEKQAPKQWHQKFDDVVLSNGYLLNQDDKLSTPMDTSEKLMPNNVGKLSRYTSNPEGYTNASWISNTKDNSSTSGWVFLLGRATVGKEAEWLRNLILEILLWSKPIALISILCDSATTLEKAYIQMYNRMSRNLGVKHSIIR